MPEIRFTITAELDKLVVNISKRLGVDKSDYVKSLILKDIREHMQAEEKDEKKKKGEQDDE